MKRGANKPSFTTSTTTGSSLISFDVTETTTSDHQSGKREQRETELSRMKEMMREQMQEFELQLGELHHLMDRQREIVTARTDIVPQVVKAYNACASE
jgi:hypothetical protein